MKVIKISCCKECVPYFNYTYQVDSVVTITGGYCQKKCKCLDIGKIDTIPAWCELEDAPEIETTTRQAPEEGEHEGN